MCKISTAQGELMPGARISAEDEDGNQGETKTQ